MARAMWKGAVLAESRETIEVEGNQYFPPGAVHWEYFTPSPNRTVCPWKGEASYYHLQVGGEVNEDAAWSYPQPKEAAQSIRDYVAFWKGVTVEV